MNWKLVGEIAVPIAAIALVGLAVTSHDDGTAGEAQFTGLDVREDIVPQEVESDTTDPSVPSPPTSLSSIEDDRLLYSATDIARYTSSMTRPGPYFATGDAGHGGPYSPKDGQRSLRLAEEFLANPQASYWVQPNLPYSSGDPWPSSMAYVRPMHAAWVYMTVPTHPSRAQFEKELKDLLLDHATHPSHDFADSSKYPISYENYAPSPIFGHAPWVTRLIKARDMLGRDAFSDAENRVIDQWFYDYANWAFKWLHHAQYGKRFPGRESRDYTEVHTWESGGRSSYDGGPLVRALAMDYTNRQAYVASAASLAANYLAFHGFSPSTGGGPDYGRFSVRQLLDHSRLFVEETIRFSVYPEGLQGDFERGDLDSHQPGSNVFPQRGWMYSMDVLLNVLDIAWYHAARGDFGVWDYGTTQGLQGTAGEPIAGGFSEKNLHFFAWSMLRYLNGDWGRTNFGEALATPSQYHGVIHAAIASRFAPEDRLLTDAWRRSGSSFPPYPSRPVSQGMYSAHVGGYGRYVGVIEHAGASKLGG